MFIVSHKCTPFSLPIPCHCYSLETQIHVLFVIWPKLTYEPFTLSCDPGNSWFLHELNRLFYFTPYNSFVHTYSSLKNDTGE